MSITDWIVIGVYTCIGAGLFYIIWQLGKERGDD